MTAQEWQPGQPLHAEIDHPNSRYLYNFRDSSEGPICNCHDAARWPSPGFHWDLGMGDELACFVAEVRVGVGS